MLFGSRSSRHSGFFSASSKSIMIDTGSNVLNQMIDVFLIFALVAAARVVALEACHCLSQGNFSKHKLKPMLKKMCKEGAFWGTILALYVAFEYGMTMINIFGGWKNAMLGGVLTGAVVSAAFNNGRDKIVEDAISGGAIATAVEVLQYLT